MAKIARLLTGETRRQAANAIVDRLPCNQTQPLDAQNRISLNY